MKTKLLSILLSIVMILTLVPISAFAAEITRVNVEITQPTLGGHPSFNVIVNDSSYQVYTDSESVDGGIVWWDETQQRELKSSDIFTEGHKYILAIALKATEGNSFSFDSEGDIITKAYVNGAEAQAAKVAVDMGTEETKVMGILKEYNFPSSQSKSQLISDVHISDIMAPMAGRQCDEQATALEDDKYAVYSIEWFDKTDDRFLESGETFKAGHTYCVQVWVEAKSGYEFNTTAAEYNMKGYINQKSAELSKAFEYQRWAMVVLSYTFPKVAEGNKITRVDIKDIIEPKIGRQSIARAHYLKYSEGVTGYKATWYVDKNFDTPFTGVFAENKSYTLEVILEAAEGYSFAVDQNGENDALVFFNSTLGDEMYFDAQGRVVARINYDNTGDAPEKILGVISYSIKAPVVGETPSYEAENQRDDELYYIDKNNAGSTKNGITWREVEGEGKTLRETDTFEAGKIYYAAIRVKPKEGYVFDTDENGDLLVSGAINGNTSLIGGNDEGVFVGIAFERLELSGEYTVISEIEATSNYPAICYMYGDYYIPRFTITKGSPATIHFTDWEVKYGNKEWEKLASNKNFSGGFARISAQIRIDGEAAKEYVLSNDTKVKVNGEEWTVSGVRVEDGCSYGHIQSPQIVPVPIEEAPTFTVTFDSCGGSKVESVECYYAYPVAEVDAPIRKGYTFDGWYKDENYSEKFVFAGSDTDEGYGRVYEDITLYAKWIKDKEDNTHGGTTSQTEQVTFVDVAKDEYYYKPVMWAVENGITSGTGANTFSPDSVCTRAQVVTFLHRMVASPEPAAIDMPFSDVNESDYFYKPVKWAVGSSITGGTSATTFSPNANCTRAQVVTFLWRAAGQPKANTKNNPFTDVSEDSYYYDAVLWAVEQGITGGTSATTFSPDANCTRAQVVTFLYRFIN